MQITGKAVQILNDVIYTNLKTNIMIGWIIAAALLAVLFALLGFTTIARGFAAIAKVLFYIFLIIFIVVVIASLF
jgi:uncharacterized membrane protein YtjA (UPF0391 family)